MVTEMSHKHETAQDIVISNKSLKNKNRSLMSGTPVLDAMHDSTAKSHSKSKSKSKSKVVEIRTGAEYDKFKQRNKRCVVFYGAEWCHACKDIEGLYARIANRYYKRVAMAHVDIDVAQLDFTHVPVFVALRNGKQIDSMEGADRAGLKELVKKAITSK